MRRAIVLVLLCTVAAASLVGCGGGTLASPDAAPVSLDGRPVFPDAALAPLDALLIDVSGAEPCVLRDVPATEVPGATCVYTLPDPPCDYVGIDHIGVKIDGVAIPRDTNLAEGWDYADATMRTIEIHGSGCAALTSGSATQVTIAFRILI